MIILNIHLHFKRIYVSLMIVFFLLISYSFHSVQYYKEGFASYYGNGFQGRKTSSGERYHKDSLTCAHLTMPFGTRLKVYCHKTKKTVIVKVNDRGPHGRKRIIDISGAAADSLGIKRLGIAWVTVSSVD